MPTTRSSNKQAKLEDVGASSKTSLESKKSPSKEAKAGQKRKAEKALEAKAAKKSKSSGIEPAEDAVESGDVIIINRAPVLELWGASVAQFLNPEVSWEICLSVGGAISTITAISKGRSIGTIDKPDPGEAQKKREERKKKAEKEGLDEIEVMSFHLKLKDGQAMVGDKPKKAGEEALIKKYGGNEQYKKAKSTFQDALKAWKGKDDQLDKQAFGFYEDFRPSIPPGQKGWGRKGQLNLQTVQTTIEGG
jgi:hypothetical protein